METKTLLKVKKIMMAIIGTLIAALGIRVIVLSGRGADALSTFILGIMSHINVQFGTVSLILNTLILVVVFFSNRKMIGLGSLINSFGLGLFLNGFDALGVFQSLLFDQPYLFALIGTLLFALGTAVYLHGDLGAGSYECLMRLVQLWTKWRVSVARIVLDGTFMLIGFLLGGTVGLGTLIVLILLGPSLDRFLLLLDKLDPETRRKRVTQAHTN